MGTFNTVGAAVNTGGGNYKLIDASGAGGTAGAIWSNITLPVAAFTAKWSFTIAGSGDGMMFVIQSSSGSAIGSDGGYLGFRGIGSSIGFKFDINQNPPSDNPPSGPGDPSANCVGFFTNGAIPIGGLNEAAVAFASGHQIDCVATYDGTTLTIQYTDTVTLATNTRNYAVNIASIVGGSTAYFGFTAAEAVATSTEHVFNISIAPTVNSFTASPSTILEGSPATLAWAITDATSASINNGVGPVNPASGSTTVSLFVTTTYALTANVFDSATALVTVIVVPRRDVHVFSTGTLFDASGNEFAVLQDVHLVPIQTQRKVLYDCPQVSKFPVDVGFFGGGAVMVATYAGINHKALQEIMSSVESGTNPIVETIGQAVAVTSFKAVLTTQDTTGKQQVWTLNKVRVPEFEIPSSTQDFTMPKFLMRAYPDGSGNIGTVALPW